MGADDEAGGNQVQVHHGQYRLYDVVVQQYLAAVCARRGVPRDDPKAQQACKRRDQVDERLKHRDCVYQEDGG
jgi:hypothetical protein